MTSLQVFAVSLFGALFFGYVLWVCYPRAEYVAKKDEPKYIISKNGYGQYFVREHMDIYYLPIFKEQCLMNMLQVEKAIKEYEEHQVKSKREEVRRIY
jgi:hypothetical protein